MSTESTPWVVKVGGDELRPGPALGQFALWAARTMRRGQPLVVVHGGGDEVTQRAESLGLPTDRREGQRVTTGPMLEVVVEVLAGRVNVRLVNALSGAGVPSVGLTGVSAGLLAVIPDGHPPGSLGWVGRPTGARVRLLRKLLDEGVVPVIAPLGSDGNGGVFNVNADWAASAIAAALAAPLWMLTDVAAVRGANGRPIGRLTPPEAGRLRSSGVATDGMIPKLDAALSALRGGAPFAWIGDLAGLPVDDSSPVRGTTIAAPGRPETTPVPFLPSDGKRGR